jgi:hypothetical protein
MHARRAAREREGVPNGRGKNTPHIDQILKPNDMGNHALWLNCFIGMLCCTIGHEGSFGLSVCKVHISATRWRLFTLTAVALRFCRATEKCHLVTEINVGQQQRS